MPLGQNIDHVLLGGALVVHDQLLNFFLGLG